MNELKNPPRLTVELDIGLRKAFKLACYAEDTTMHDKIIELIQAYISQVSE